MIRWIVLYAMVMLVVNGWSADFHELGYQYLFPNPEATEVSAHATVIVRFKEMPPRTLINLDSFITVRGETESYVGSTKIASDNRTIIFKPSAPFKPGERINVSLAPLFPSLNSNKDLHYSFYVSSKEHHPLEFKDQTIPELHRSASALGQPQIMPNGVSVPSDFPHISIDVNEDPSDGYIFINNWGPPYYNMILEPDGSPIWYQKTEDERRDMKIQDNGLLTMLVRKGYPFGQGFIAMDNTYTVVDSFHASHGFATDEHELQVLENGHYLLFGIRTMTVDMSKILPDGKKEARVHETGIQEFTPEGELIFHWRAWDNFDPQDMIGYSDDSPMDNSFRFPHMNSIDIDTDGHIILSSKRLSEVTKIHRQTGEILWRLGGANNDFEFVNDPLFGFSMQHSVRALGNNRYTVFDNGVFHDPQVSRALEYELDIENWTATLVWNFVEEPPTYAFHMGNVQRLPNGNTLINWAVQGLPKAQEVRPDGSVAYQMNFVDRFKTYRAFKFPWNGMAKKPLLFVEQQLDNVTLIFNTFGDPNVDFYNIYAGTSRRPTTLKTTSKQTLLKLYDLKNRQRYYFRVTAVDKNGNESPFSNEEELVVSMTNPGQEMVRNGNFSEGKNGWGWLVRGGAQANWQVQESAARIEISNGGGNDHDIQLTQSGIELVQGREYTFEFEAWAASPRTIEAKIAENGGSFTNYSGSGATALQRSRNLYSYTFLMNESTDLDARIVFNVGANTSDVFITNVSVKMAGGTDVTVDENKVLQKLQLFGNYPNPFNAQTTIEFSLPTSSNIKIEVFDLMGRFVAEIANKEFSAGAHNVTFDASFLSSGVYFYHLTANNLHGVEQFSQWQKMMLVK